jgi:hemerythrin-like metal-binding protein
VDERGGRHLRYIDRLVVKGKNRPQSVYEVFDHEDGPEIERKEQTRSLFEEAVALYHLRKVDEARRLLERCVARNPHDNPAKVYLARCAEYAATGAHTGCFDFYRNLEWGPTFEIGESTIDAQHRELLKRSLGLIRAFDEGESMTTITGIFAFLDQYAVEHFECEESLMVAHRYVFLEPHREQHHRFIALLAKLEGQAAEPGINAAVLTFQVQVFLTDWLLNHILEDDKHFGKALRAVRA